MTVEEWKRKNPPIRRKPPTNYDRLRAKSAEEMAEKIGVARGELASVEAAQAEV